VTVPRARVAPAAPDPPPPPDRRIDDDWRLAAFFACYFATAGVFAPYFPLYLAERDLSAAQIGIILAVGQGMRVLGPNLWGYLADRHADRLQILRWTALATCASFAPIFAGVGFGFVFCVMLAVNFFITAQMPLAEAIAATRLRGDARAPTRYGRLRAVGSLGFIVSVLACGPLLEYAGTQWQPILSFAMLAICVWVAFVVRDAPHQEPAHTRVSVRARLAEARVRWFFGSASLMVFAHGALYTYLSLYLARLGYSKTQIGVAWAIGVVAEVLFFSTQGRFFRRFNVFSLLTFSFVVAAARFVLIAEFARWWLVLVLAQCLHAITFAVHHSASILTVQQWFSGAASARGQALYISLAYGVGGTLGSLVAAWLWVAVDPAAARRRESGTSPARRPRAGRGPGARGQRR